MLRRLSSGAPGPPQHAAVRALRGEEVLAWTQGSERREADSADIGGRKRLLRRGPTPGLPALLVVSQARRGGALRVHLLAEVGTSARTWGLQDLRLVDGLGVGAREATEFALTFAGAPRPLYWRCDSPEQRARFLWSLLEVCVARLQSKAPPSQRLSLLDLQTFAKEVAEDSPKPLAVKRKSDSDARPEPDQRVIRTTSEPQAGALNRLIARAETTNSRRSIDGPPVARPPTETAAGAGAGAGGGGTSAERDLTVYEHAFVLAARRLGARPPQFKRSRPQSPIGVAAPCSPPGLLHDTEEGSATEMLVARCKAQEERKQYRLVGNDASDLEYALEAFFGDEDNQQLSAFAEWTRNEMTEIETKNMADTVDIELEPQSEVVAAYRAALVESVSEAQEYLLPAEARLAPFSELIEEIRGRVELLDRHRRNVSDLRDLLEDLLEHAVWTEEEEQKVAEIRNKVKENPNILIEDDKFTFGTVVPVLDDVAEKLSYASHPDITDDVAAFAETRANMKTRRDEIVKFLTPAFKERSVMDGLRKVSLSGSPVSSS